MTQQTAVAAIVSSLTPRERLIRNLTSIINRTCKAGGDESLPCVILEDGTMRTLGAPEIESQLANLVDAYGGLGIRGAGRVAHWCEVSPTIREALARETRPALAE